MRLAVSPGLWSLSVYGIPIAMLAALAGLVLLAGVLSGNENLTRNAASLAAYGAMPWDQSLLVGTAPAYLMVPASWLAWALELRLHTAVPFMIIPIAAIIWNALDPKPANVAQSYGETYN